MDERRGVKVNCTERKATFKFADLNLTVTLTQPKQGGDFEVNVVVETSLGPCSMKKAATLPVGHFLPKIVEKVVDRSPEALRAFQVRLANFLNGDPALPYDFEIPLLRSMLDCREEREMEEDDGTDIAI